MDRIKMLDILQKSLEEAKRKSPEEIAASFKRVNDRFLTTNYEFPCELNTHNIAKPSHEKDYQYCNKKNESMVSINSSFVTAA